MRGCMSKKEYKTYFGKRFYKDKKGYYVNSMPIHAQRWVWICHHGMIPEGLDVHHKDGDKGNNEISNLELVTRSEHLKKHHALGSYDYEQRKEQLAEARRWLRTPQGRKKQSEKAIIGWRKRKPLIKKCNHCGNNFPTFQPWAKFCHPNCYAGFRRKNKIGFIEKKCWICDKLFLTEKSSRVRTCGKECGIKLQVLHQK